MSGAALSLPPLDPEPASTLADGDRKRRERYLRRLLAEGGMSLSRTRLAATELREVVGQKAKNGAGR